MGEEAHPEPAGIPCHLAKANSPEKILYDTQKNQCGKMSKGEEGRPRALLLLILFGDHI